MYYDNRKLALSILWAILGIALVILSITEVLDSSVYAGMGGALTAIGILQIIKQLRYRNDAAYREMIDTAVQDERNSFLRMKSWSWAGYIAILVEGIGAIVAMILGQHTIQLVLSCSICLILCAYWIAYVIMSRKY